MPVHPGPWISKPVALIDRTITFVESVSSIVASTSNAVDTAATSGKSGTTEVSAATTSGTLAADFAALCETTAGPIEPLHLDAGRVEVSPTGIALATQKTAIELELRFQGAEAFLSGWPAGVIGVQYETPLLDAASWMLTSHIAFTAHAINSRGPDTTLQARQAPTVDLLDIGVFTAGATLGTWPLQQQSLVPAGVDEDVAFSFDIDATSWGATFIGVSGNPMVVTEIAINPDRIITHAAPPYPGTGISGFECDPVLSYHVTGSYLPPRYRFIYSTTVLPPLRQWPRDDFLGGAPRQGTTNQPRSLQASARQGWTNSYR